jgi:hypothetical protein
MPRRRYTLDLSLTPDSFKPKVGPNKWGKQTVEEYTKQYWLSQDIAMLQANGPTRRAHGSGHCRRHAATSFACTGTRPCVPCRVGASCRRRSFPMIRAAL